MSKVNSILNYIKSYQESIEGLRQNVPGFTFNGFTVTVGNEDKGQVITVFGIVNTELDKGAMDAITQTVPKLYQSITSINTTDYGQIIKEPNAPIYYNQTIEIVTTNEEVSELKVMGKSKGNGRDDFLVADDIPEMPVNYTYKDTYYTYAVVTPEEGKKPLDEQLGGNNEVSGDEADNDPTEKEANEFLGNLLGKNEESIDLNSVIGKLLGNNEEPEWDKVIVSIPEEHLTLTDDITFETEVGNNTRETVITIKGVDNPRLFNVGHKLTLTTRVGDVASDITTGIIDDVETDDYGLHVWVSEQLKPSPVKEESGVVNSYTNKEKLPIESYAKGEPGVEGKPVSVKGTSTGSTKADHIVLKGVKITLGDITLSADELVFDGIVNLNKED